MLALLFFALADGPEVQQTHEHASNDWTIATPAQKQQTNKDEFDPSAKLYQASDMCVVIAGQPLPECAKIASQTPIQLSDDIFANGVGGNESTCQTVETIRRDTNGNPQRVYATYCGEELGRSDYRTVQTPTLSNSATRPTQRAIGPNEVGSASN